MRGRIDVEMTRAQCHALADLLEQAAREEHRALPAVPRNPTGSVAAMKALQASFAWLDAFTFYPDPGDRPRFLHEVLRAKAVRGRPAASVTVQFSRTQARYIGERLNIITRNAGSAALRLWGSEGFLWMSMLGLRLINASTARRGRRRKATHEEALAAYQTQRLLRDASGRRMKGPPMQLAADALGVSVDTMKRLLRTARAATVR